MGRTQYVSIGNVHSPPMVVSAGVPQGSTLGPLLFLLYINDMSRCTTNLQLIHFADDTTAMAQGTDFHDLCYTVNEDLARVDVWLCANRLSLNIDKTSYMVFSNRSWGDDQSIKIRDSPIALTKSAKFLGMSIDDKLTFVNHIRHVCLKISRSNGILWRLSLFVPPYILRKLYQSLIYPYFVVQSRSLGWGSAVQSGEVECTADEVCKTCRWGCRVARP